MDMETTRLSAETLPAETPSASRSELAPSDLVQRARAGELAAFGQLYRLHLSSIHGLALRMVHDRALAEDLTQDVFVAAWKALPSFRGASAFSTWLYRLAIRVVLKGCRTQRRYRHQLEVEVMDDREQPLAIELRIDLQRAILALPPGARVVLVLHDVLGFRSDEIAVLIDRAVGTVKSQLHRARKLLAEATRQ